MKIGILTFHDGINFGCFLQAYALFKFLKNNINHDVCVINYKEYKHWENERRCFYNIKLNKYRNPVNHLKYNYPKIIYQLKTHLKVKKFKRIHKKLNLTKFTHSIEDVNKLKLDIIIVGSDEIWNFKHPLVGFIPIYYGIGIEKSKLISYGPSFGAVNSSIDLPDDIKHGLSAFTYLSCRDTNSNKILEKNFPEKSPKIVLDPVFLYPFDNEIKTPKAKDYILFYSAGGFEKEYINIIKNFARSKNKKLITIGYNHLWCDEIIHIADPFDFMGYINNAAFIVTTMFHGTMCAIKLKKQFAVIHTPYRSNKFDYILQSLNLLNRFVDNSTKSLSDLFEKKINYSDINNKLDRLKEESKNFLIHSIQ